MSVNRLTSPFLALLAAGALAAPAEGTDGVQSLAGIRAAAENAVAEAVAVPRAGLHLEAAALDPRLRLAACTARPGTYLAPVKPTQSRLLVRVTCAAPAWTVNVPVDVKREHDVLVLRRAIGRGEAIAAADVVTEKRVLPGVGSPFVARLADLPGRLTRRPLPEGTAVAADALSAVLLIHRGQTVTLAALAGGVEVRAPGLALADASAQQRVRVQNLSSLKIVEGVADTDGVVRVRF